MSEPASLRFCVLMATYNGERFLDEQLRSLENQTVGRIDVIVSDDGSTDATRARLEDWARRWAKGSFDVRDGPSAGFSENFRSLLRQPDIDAEYIALCDQDDVWDTDKLAVAKRFLDEVPAGRPAVYCGRTRLMSEDGRLVGMSPLMSRDPTFRNALVQSIAGGNTMVMNLAAFRLMQEACDGVQFVSHDWWTYLVISGAGGVVFYDSEPRVSYRQHSGNVIGANTSARARFFRFGLLMQGQWRGWMSSNLGNLQAKGHLLTEENRQLVDDVMRARRLRNGLHRAWALTRLRLYRQSGIANFSFMLAALAGKI